MSADHFVTVLSIIGGPFNLNIPHNSLKLFKSILKIPKLYSKCVEKTHAADDVN